MKSIKQFKRYEEGRNVLRTAIIVALSMFTCTIGMKAQMTSGQIDSIAEKAFNSLDNTVGFAVGVVKDGKVVYSKGFGSTSVGSEEAVSADTPFGIASNSKAFTSAALAILVDQGKLNWEDKVVKYIPEFKMYDNYVTNNFNVQDLLTHRSGLGLGAGDLMIFPDGSNFTIDDVLSSFQYFEPTTPFRTRFDYDNLLYLVAGELTARVSGMTWEDFVSKEILVPLQMENSYPGFLEASKNKGLAVQHFFDGNSLIPISTWEDDLSKGQRINGAAGGIWASANDMNKWMLAQLNQGKFGPQLNKTLFSEEQHREMWRMHTPMDNQKDPRSPFKVHFAGYGLGWFLSDFNGYLKVEHSGLIAGMSSEVTLIPELDLGIVVLNNSQGADFLNGLIGFILLDEYLNLDTGVNWLEMAKGMQNQQMDDPETEKVWDKVASNKNVKFSKQNYVGVYKDDWFGKVEVYEKDDALWFKSHKSPRLNGKMLMYEDHTFAIKWEYQDMNADAFAIFSLGKNGKAINIKMKGISRFIDFSFDFQDLNLKKI